MLSGHLQINQLINQSINNQSWQLPCIPCLPTNASIMNLFVPWAHPPSGGSSSSSLYKDPEVKCSFIWSLCVWKSLFLLPGIKSFILWSNCSPKSRALLVKLLANKLMDIFLVPTSKALRPIVSMDDICNLYDLYLPFNWAFLSLNHLFY